jgi:hypothetical protein
MPKRRLPKNQGNLLDQSAEFLTQWLVDVRKAAKKFESSLKELTIGMAKVGVKQLLSVDVSEEYRVPDDLRNRLSLALETISHIDFDKLISSINQKQTSDLGKVSDTLKVIGIDFRKKREKVTESDVLLKDLRNQRDEMMATTADSVIDGLHSDRLINTDFLELDVSNPFIFILQELVQFEKRVFDGERNKLIEVLTDKIEEKERQTHQRRDITEASVRLRIYGRSLNIEGLKNASEEELIAKKSEIQQQTIDDVLRGVNPANPLDDPKIQGALDSFYQLKKETEDQRTACIDALEKGIVVAVGRRLNPSLPMDKSEESDEEHETAEATDVSFDERLSRATLALDMAGEQYRVVKESVQDLHELLANMRRKQNKAVDGLAAHPPNTGRSRVR